MAAPSLITLRVQDNPSVIYWKNEGIYFGLLNFQSTNSVNFDPGFEEYNYTDISDQNQIVLGATLEGLAFELWHSEGGSTSKTSTRESESKSTETYIQGAFGSDVVSFGYTNVGRGSDKQKQTRKGINTNWCCYNGQNFSVYEDYTDEYQEDKEESVYGFSLKFGNFYTGAARRLKKEKNKQSIRKGNQIAYYPDGTTEDKTINETYKNEDIEYHRDSIGIAYYINDPTGNAFHFEISKEIRPEKRVEARNSDYSSSSKSPWFSESILIEGSIAGLVITYEKTMITDQVPSWSSGEENKKEQDVFALFYKFENFQF